MTLKGGDGLARRLKALEQSPKDMLRVLQLAVVAEAKARVPRKTGNLGRNILPGSVTTTHARVEARTPYAAYVEMGTGIYGPKHKPITPKHAKVLAWRTGASKPTRLSGRVRRGDQGQTIFARSVKGRPATPYLEPGAEAAAKRGGLDKAVIKVWNDAD